MPKDQPSSPSSGPDEAALTFEEAMERVETIVRDLEGDRVPLDSLLDGYSTGTRLLKICQARIDEAQARIEMVATGRDGEKQAVPFDGPAAATDAPAPTTRPSGTKESKATPDDIRLF
ncbi:hypothetical protein BH23VER1_BH23VER1_28730 [soil metagenome]